MLPTYVKAYTLLSDHNRHAQLTRPQIRMVIAMANSSSNGVNDLHTSMAILSYTVIDT